MIPSVTCVIMLIIISTIDSNKEEASLQPREYKELGEHATVTDSGTFPYVVAILKKTSYISAGALIDDAWVITAADSLFLLREFSRILRVRLGSINHKKGGILVPIKYFQIHPYFDDNKPQYDIALIRLTQPVRLMPSLNPIRLKLKTISVATTHFLVTGWQTRSKISSYEQSHRQMTMEDIKRHRLLTVSHLHPTYPEECFEQLSISGLNHTDTLMCLDPAVGTNPCERQAGAPVVLNGVLWGIVSSWKPEDCDIESGPMYVVLVAAKNISSWLQAIRHERSWSPKKQEDENLFSNIY